MTADYRRMHPALLLVLAVAVGVVRVTDSECWDHPSCQELNSKRNFMEYIRLGRSDSSIIPDDARSGPPPSSDPLSLSHFSSFSSSPQAKRSNFMENIRFYTTNNVEESAKLFPGKIRKRDLSRETIKAKGKDEKVGQGEMEPILGDVHEKTNGTYKMKHFRWSAPLPSKRYGGFMKSWGSQRPLLTLFKNVINKGGLEKK
ncbi:pro-opiomelanocortin-like [Odontesthes bonariensis]|uniref:pro-opiomelanocortin-like n=1 Tax=Odontesthes bonariensis TaxID=219752 RepID=UPI003F58A01B